VLITYRRSGQPISPIFTDQ